MAEPEVTQPFVLVVLSKDADAKVMQHTFDVLSSLQVVTETVRLDDADIDLSEYIQSRVCRGLGAVVFGAHYSYTDELYPTIAETTVSAIKVITGPVPATSAQIALSIPVAGFGVDGAIKAGLFAARVLAGIDPALAVRLRAFQPPS